MFAKMFGVCVENIHLYIRTTLMLCLANSQTCPLHAESVKRAACPHVCLIKGQECVNFLHIPGPVMDLERGIPAQFQIMPHRHKSCAALCPSENLKRTLPLFVTQRQWLLLCFKDPHFIILDPSLQDWDGAMV